MKGCIGFILLFSFFILSEAATPIVTSVSGFDDKPLGTWTTITVHGSNFGNTPSPSYIKAVINSPWVDNHLNENSTCQIDSCTDTAFTCALSQVLGANLTMYVFTFVGATTYPGVGFKFNSPAPVVYSVKPVSTDGGSADINATYVNSLLGGVYGVSINGNSTEYRENLLFSVPIPAGTGYEVPLTITVNGQSVTVPYSYEAPRTGQFNNIGTLGGELYMAIVNAGQKASDIVITGGGYTCQDLNFTYRFESSFVNCYMPGPLPEGVLNITMSVNGNVGYTQTYVNLPYLSNVTGPPTTGGNVLVRMSSIDPVHNSFKFVVSRTLDFSNPRELEYVGYFGPDGNQAYYLEYNLSTPGVGHYYYNLTASIDPNLYSHSGFFLFAAPIISSISSTVVSYLGGPITIFGTNLGTDPANISLTLVSEGLTKVITADSISPGYAVWIAPPYSSDPFSSWSMDVAGVQPSSGPLPFAKLQYKAPQITTMSTVNVTGGPVTIYGQYFGTEIANISVNFGTYNCNVSSVVDNQLVCNVGAGTGSNLQIRITIAGFQVNFTTPTFSFLLTTGSVATIATSSPSTTSETLGTSTGQTSSQTSGNQTSTGTTGPTPAPLETVTVTLQLSGDVSSLNTTAIEYLIASALNISVSNMTIQIVPQAKRATNSTFLVIITVNSTASSANTWVNNNFIVNYLNSSTEFAQILTSANITLLSVKAAGTQTTTTTTTTTSTNKSTTSTNKSTTSSPTPSPSSDSSSSTSTTGDHSAANHLISFGYFTVALLILNSVL